MRILHAACDLFVAQLCSCSFCAVWCLGFQQNSWFSISFIKNKIKFYKKVFAMLFKSRKFVCSKL